jgi:hypothetical protein
VERREQYSRNRLRSDSCSAGTISFGRKLSLGLFVLGSIALLCSWCGYLILERYISIGFVWIVVLRTLFIFGLHFGSLFLEQYFSFVYILVVAGSWNNHFEWT